MCDARTDAGLGARSLTGVRRRAASLDDVEYEVNYDVWGNVAFGLLAKKLGVRGWVATFGAWVDGRKDGDNSPQDQVSIDIGYELADEIGGEWSLLTADMVIAAVIERRHVYETLVTEDDPSRVRER